MPTFTTDPTTETGLVRLLINDTDAAAPLFTDPQITAFLTLEGSVKRAAAQALDTIASNEAMVQKVVRIMDLSVDGPAVARELRARATALREQDVESGETFDIIELAHGDFGLREVWWNGVLRDAV